MLSSIKVFCKNCKILVKLKKYDIWSQNNWIDLDINRLELPVPLKEV